jgi:hypothetical protein
MLKKTITYTNFDGKEEQFTAYFNLNKTECVDLNLEYERDGGLIGRIKKLMSDTIDGKPPAKPAIDFVKLLVERSYGERPADNPSLFLKEDDDGRPLFKKFKQTAAYDAYVYALMTGEESLEEFAEHVMPQVTPEQRAEAQKIMDEEGLTPLFTGA